MFSFKLRVFKFLFTDTVQAFLRFLNACDSHTMHFLLPKLLSRKKFCMTIARWRRWSSTLICSNTPKTIFYVANASMDHCKHSQQIHPRSTARRLAKSVTVLLANQLIIPLLFQNQVEQESWNHTNPPVAGERPIPDWRWDDCQPNLAGHPCASCSLRCSNASTWGT